MSKLEESNQQPVTVVVEQRQELPARRKEGKRQNTDADVTCVRTKGMTLLVRNSMLRDVRLNKTADGKQIKIPRKSGVTFTDIGEMIDDIGYIVQPVMTTLPG